MRRLQLALLVVGTILFVLVVRRAGSAEIVEKILQVGWYFAAILLADLMLDLLHTMGWRRCFLPEARRIPILDLFLCRKAGVAINTLTPTATLGGEAVKAILVRRWVSLREASAAVLIDKLAFALGQAVFLGFGLFPLFQSVLRGPTERATAITILALWTGGLLAFVALQRTGLFGRGARALRAAFGFRLGEEVPNRVAALDDRISGFLRDRLADVVASLLFHAVAQAIRIAQFWLALRGLGFEPELVECFTLAAGFVFVEATLFLVPGKLGVLEGGNLLAFTMLGFDASTALAVAFVMRISDLVALLPGLVAFVRYSLRPADLRDHSRVRDVA